MKESIDILFAGLSKFTRNNDFTSLLESFIELFKTNGVNIDRMQIPMNKSAGFRHPLYQVMVLTWRASNVEVTVKHHQKDLESLESYLHHMRQTPYAPLLFDGLDFIRYDLTKERPYPIFDTFYEEGIRDYCAFVLNFPNGSRQFVTLATKDEEGFPAALEQIITDVAKILSTTLFAAYQISVSISIATTYLGKTTGVRVLNGEISRGEQNQLEAGIMFCDIRGFTAMSERLGAEGMIPILNDIFEQIATEVTGRGGEILKFIGDAMLIIFPCTTKTEERVVSTKMIEVAIQSVKGVEKIGEANGLPLSVGFGCHIGTVLYGNIGAAERLSP